MKIQSSLSDMVNTNLSELVSILVIFVNFFSGIRDKI